jgi:hypothetical protein
MVNNLWRNMNRRSAKTWPYPRHSNFQRTVRKAAAAWFAANSYPTNPRTPYILAEWNDWPRNIILPEVSQYIQEAVTNQRKDGNNFSLHKYIHHGLSSQAMVFNLVGPLLVMNDLSPLKRVVERHGLEWPGEDVQAIFEYEDREVFNERQGQPTSIDLVIDAKDGSSGLYIEAKFTEHEFGGCSLFQSGDCDGRNPSKYLDLCYLHHIGRKYWSLIHKYDLQKGSIGTDAGCILSNHYQFFRELLFALEKGGTFVLLSDDRNPVFYSSGPQGERGLMPFLTELLPTDIQKRVALISIQELIAEIHASEEHTWAVEFMDKYGISVPGDTV